MSSESQIKDLSKKLFPHKDTPLNYLPGTGKLENLTSEQQENFKIFKDEILKQPFYDKERHNDHYLLRFLRARKFNLQATFEMLQINEDWRKRHNVQDLVKSFVLPNKEQFQKYYPRAYHKCDKQGNPLYIEILGDLDVSKIEEILAPEETDKNKKFEKSLNMMVKQIIVGYEYLENVIFPECSKKYGTHIEQCLTILDLKNLSLNQVTSGMSFIKEASKIAQNHYPETMYKMFIINSPLLFRGAWSMIKGFVDPVTSSKITILGSSYKHELLKYIDENQLPMIFGGKCCCEEGCQFSNAGPWNHSKNEHESMIHDEL